MLCRRGCDYGTDKGNSTGKRSSIDATGKTGKNIRSSPTKKGSNRRIQIIDLDAEIQRSRNGRTARSTDRKKSGTFTKRKHTNHDRIRRKRFYRRNGGGRLQQRDHGDGTHAFFRVIKARYKNSDRIHVWHIRRRHAASGGQGSDQRHVTTSAATAGRKEGDRRSCDLPSVIQRLVHISDKTFSV